MATPGTAVAAAGQVIGGAGASVGARLWLTHGSPFGLYFEIGRWLPRHHNDTLLSAVRVAG
jgi:hypothetical protein